MVHPLCWLWGHQRTRVAFATNRFYCRRCRIALDPDPTPDSTPPSPRLAEARARVPRLLAAAAGRIDRGPTRQRRRWRSPPPGVAK